MRILQLIPHLGSGGAERFVVDLSNQLVAEGHQVTLCTLWEPRDELGFYIQDLSPKVDYFYIGKTKGFSLTALCKLAKLIFKVHPDIIHTHLNSVHYVFCVLLLWKRGVHTVHNEAAKESGNIANRWSKRTLFWLGRLIPVTISNKSFDSFVDYYHLKPVLIYNGRNVSNQAELDTGVVCEIAGYRKTPHTRIITQIARFEPEKRIPLMTRVASKLFAEGYDFCLLNIGNTRNKFVLEEVLKYKSDCQYLLGEKNNCIDYLKLSDAFVLSSEYEGMPISLIEAFGCGVVPICTPAGGIVDMIDGNNGLLADDHTEESLYRALKKYLDMSEADLEPIKRASKESYHKYSIEECSRMYGTLYRKCLNNRNRL